MRFYFVDNLQDPGLVFIWLLVDELPDRGFAGAGFVEKNLHSDAHDIHMDIILQPFFREIAFNMLYLWVTVNFLEENQNHY